MTTTNTGFPVHSLESAPTAARGALEGAQKKFGMVPNLLAVLAESPAALQAYVGLGDAFDTTALSATERNVVWLTTARGNSCTYCLAVHTAVARMGGVPDGVIDAIRSDRPLADTKLQALRVFTSALVSERGHVGEQGLAAFLAAGFTRAHVLDVLVGVTQKTLSNYMNHITHTPLDSAFAGAAWQPPR